MKMYVDLPPCPWWCYRLIDSSTHSFIFWCLFASIISLSSSHYHMSSVRLKLISYQMRSYDTRLMTVTVAAGSLFGGYGCSCQMQGCDKSLRLWEQGETPVLQSATMGNNHCKYNTQLGGFCSILQIQISPMLWDVRMRNITKASRRENGEYHQGFENEECHEGYVREDWGISPRLWDGRIRNITKAMRMRNITEALRVRNITEAAWWQSVEHHQGCQVSWQTIEYHTFQSSLQRNNR